MENEIGTFNAELQVSAGRASSEKSAGSVHSSRSSMQPAQPGAIASTPQLTDIGGANSISDDLLDSTLEKNIRKIINETIQTTKSSTKTKNRKKSKRRRAPI